MIQTAGRSPVPSLSASPLPSTLPQPHGVRERLCSQPVVTHFFLCSRLPSFPSNSCLLSPGLEGTVTTPPQFPGGEPAASSRAGWGPRCWASTVRAVSRRTKTLVEEGRQGSALSPE